MSKTSQFVCYYAPLPASEEQNSSPLTTLFAAGIINPFGPTLALLAASGDMSCQNSVPLLRITLNPFMQESMVVGEAIFGETWNAPEDYAPFFPLGLLGCPTLLIPGNSLGAKESAQLFGCFLASFNDGRNAFREINKYPGRPCERIASHAHSLADKSKRMMDSADELKIGLPPNEKMPPKEALQFARIQLKPQIMAEEIRAFIYFWKGSIDFLGESEMANNALTQNDFLKIFARLAVTMKIPEL